MIFPVDAPDEPALSRHLVDHEAVVASSDHRDRRLAGSLLAGTDRLRAVRLQLRPMADEPRCCRLCGTELTTGLVATDSRQCCLNATPIAGTCPEHGPLGPHHVTDDAE